MLSRPPRLRLADQIPDDLGGLFPRELRPYAPLVKRALVEFCERLPAEAQRDIAAGQEALGESAPLPLRLFALLSASPTLHKLGQVVARDPRLHPDLRSALQRLETLPSRIPARFVRSWVTAELGKLPCGPEDIVLGEAVLAEASVAVVLPFRWLRGPGDEVDGVFKLLKPGVRDRLERELAALPDIGNLLEVESRKAALPAPDYGDAFVRVRDLLEKEVQLELEQANLADVSKDLAGVAGVAVPEALPLSTPSMTAMTRLFGRKVTEAAGSGNARSLARTLAEIAIAGPLFAAAGPSVFHADPHAGNLLETDDGRLGILDWCLTGSLEKRERVEITRLLVATLNFDAARLVRITSRLTAQPLDRRAARAPIQAALQGLRLGDVPTLSSIFAMLDRVAGDASARFGGNLILFRKSLHTVQGVLHDLAPGFSLDRYLVQRGIEQALLDLPRRLFSMPFSHRFGTHLSNFDLARFLSSGPATAFRLLRRG